MMITRRRFLAITAAAMAAPAQASPVRWRGRAMGADVGVTLDAPESVAIPAIQKVKALLSTCENLFSLHDPNSTLSRLNRERRLSFPPDRFYRLVELCSEMHILTEGRFDPTIQPAWRAMATGGDVEAARAAIGWERVSHSSKDIRLGPGQALSLNGIAQGYATDLVTRALRDAGMSKVLVNIGEYHGIGRHWNLGVSDPLYGIVAIRRMRDRAMATSSPGALLFDDNASHIVNPLEASVAHWSTVSIEAEHATVADALSTALCHASSEEIKSVLRNSRASPLAICVGHDGKIEFISR
ncbi:MAG: FAD:protein FMN transferase [Roseovarius sp.]|nr:FAD:protein FMN transferase [Roseovarius sp.]